MIVLIIMTTTNDDILSSLEGVGLHENEAQVYLAALELGPSSIWDIAIKSAIKRPTCYVLMNNLMFKGYASSTFDGKRHIYTVSSPKQLLSAFNRRQEKLAKTLNQLEGLASKSSFKPDVRLYEGKAGVVEVYNLTLDLGKEEEILIYGNVAVETSYQEFIADYLKARVKKKIKVRAILPDTLDNRKIVERDDAELRETRFLPIEKFKQKTEVNIFGKSIAYIAHSEKEPFATVIENSTLADEERSRFNLLWEIPEK
ncbi:TPA: hypothetical protein DD449_04140 [Candidatus Berkelbacteria bacterium]|uniref:Transcriptional regulator TrmB n=1 Tax=Berkelbacteria bacterium GW2011_GWE1_39_12 TaxID=1618337 RepID=A0A0G4B342_9BACT|nr:MAG: transcriptional regulator TrmB [Berkelbacteria bacterium GW2011_GWE1_39_12]HBO60845.1 hypothetical protein [Candidatus Berkelbacteria bacterium]